MKLRVNFGVWAPMCVFVCALLVHHLNNKGYSLQGPPATSTAAAVESPPKNEMTAKLSAKVSKVFKVSPHLAEEIVRSAQSHAEREGLPASLVLAVIAKESSFKPKVINNKDYGLMQVNAYWHREAIAELGGVKALLSVDKNIQAGTRILAGYVRKYGVYGGLRAYNGRGKSNPYPTDVLKFQKIFS